MAVAVGVLLACGLTLLTRRHVMGLFVGLVILSHAVNLLIFDAGGLTRGAPPIVEEETPDDPVANPLSQALILTAIVIGLGVQSFLLILVYRLVHEVKSPDLAEMRETEPGGAASGEGS